jgi:tRNA threonylcarbamoyladenosine biosynthesis protein TsaB
MILCLETATSICSVALCDRTGIISVKESRENKSHARLLTPLIAELLHEQGINTGNLDAIAVSKGPGSYTGLRIGVSVSKGIAYASSIPLIGIETTLSMFYGIKDTADEKYRSDDKMLYCPMLDAKRMEVYYSLFDSSGRRIRGISASVINKESFAEIPESVRILFFGDGAGKCRDIITHTNSIFADDFEISATHMHIPVYEAFDTRHFENVAYFEPFYLKDFIATVPKKNIVGK